jgi:RNA polymerase-binding transcription factor DksA
MIETNDYKLRLETELAQITETLTTLATQNPDLASDWIPHTNEQEMSEADENVQADTNEAYENRTAIVADLETRFNNLNRALEKIAAGTYGVCEVSGEPIEKARLDANPAARTCIAHLDEELSLG